MTNVVRNYVREIQVVVNLTHVHGMEGIGSTCYFKNEHM